MANKRMIYQDFFEDEYFGTVEIPLRLLWIGLITAVADDQGRILDNSSLIKAKVFLFDRDITEDMIDKWLYKLNADNKIVRYKADSKQLIQIINWWEYQTPAWASASKYPPPNDWTDRVRCHVSGPTQGGKVHTENWNKDGGFSSEQSKELRSKQGSYQSSGIDDVNGDVDGDVNGKSEIKDARSDFQAFQQVWEQETGSLVTGFTEFERMCKRFEQEGVTPDLYRTAIQEQSKSDYPVKRPTSVKEWAIGLANPKSVKVNIPKRKQTYIGPNGEEIEREV